MRLTFESKPIGNESRVDGLLATLYSDLCERAAASVSENLERAKAWRRKGRIAWAEQCERQAQEWTQRAREHAETAKRFRAAGK